LAISPFSRKGGGSKHGHDWPETPGKERPLAAGVPLDEFIPRELTKRKEFVVLNRPRSAEAERYRRLVSILEHDSGSPPRIVTVTSAMPAEGKTTTAVNLALALAENLDQSTLLLDADLRRPTLSRYVKPQPKYGLSEVLQGKLPIEHALLRIKDAGLVLLPAGATDPNPLRLFRAERFVELMAELRESFDRIVVDTPPSVPFADAAVINGCADGALLVVRAARTARSQIEQAVTTLAGAGKVLGAVLNDVRATPIDRYYYGTYGYDLDKYYERDPGDEG